MMMLVMMMFYYDELVSAFRRNFDCESHIFNDS